MELTQFIETLKWEDLSERTQEITKLCVLDLLGCALAGSQDASTAPLITSMREMEGGTGCPIWGTHLDLGLNASIFVNSYTASLYDLDDGHRKAQGHPGAAIVPAALNAAYKNDLSGKAFLEAVVVGYEVAIRSALIIRELGGPRKGSGGWVAPGVAAAVARILGLQGDAIANSLGLAEYYAPQATQDRSVKFPSQMKEGLPWGTHSGFFAATLASRGFTAMRPHLFDSSWCDDIGETFEIENTYFKKYACCRWAHPAIDGLEALRGQMDFSHEDIEKITISTFEKALPLCKTKPTNTLEAVYSIPFALSTFVVNGRVNPADVDARSLKNSSVLALAERIHLEEEPEFTKEFPYKCLERVTVEFKNGNVERSGVLSAKGDPDNPYSNEEMLQKFEELAGGVLGESNQVPDVIKTLDERPVSDLVALLVSQS
jgi:2-methylcitrate dehydratase PrpD